MSKNLPASVRKRLTNTAKETDRPFQVVLQYFALERFLYCLTRSRYADKFVLKGSLMFTAKQSAANMDALGACLRMMQDVRVTATS